LDRQPDSGPPHRAEAACERSPQENHEGEDIAGDLRIAGRLGRADFDADTAAATPARPPAITNVLAVADFAQLPVERPASEFLPAA
jgi:hypothetical protein